MLPAINGWYLASYTTSLTPSETGIQHELEAAISDSSFSCGGIVPSCWSYHVPGKNLSSCYLWPPYWPWFRAALVWVKWHHSQTSGLLCINVSPVTNKNGKTRLEIQAGTWWSPFSVLSFRSDVEPKPLLQLLFKVENPSCHYDSQKNKKQSSTLTYRPASPFPLEENGFCVKLSQPNPKPRDVCFRFCYKARTQAKFGKKRKKKNLGKVSSISRPIYGFEWKPYSIHYFHRGLIWNQAQTGSFKLTFASSYTENQTQHIFLSIQAHRVLIRMNNSQSPLL